MGKRSIDHQYDVEEERVLNLLVDALEKMMKKEGERRKEKEEGALPGWSYRVYLHTGPSLHLVQEKYSSTPMLVRRGENELQDEVKDVSEENNLKP